jgi:electron transport complex protein RnfB
MIEILTPASIIALTGLFVCICLFIAHKKFSVSTDPRVDKILSFLPRVDCGACGYGRCAGFARAITENTTDPAGCVPGGSKSTAHISEIMGTEIQPRENVMAVVHCKGGDTEAKNRAIYEGIADCYAAVLAGNGARICSDGCLGLGTCVRACLFDAMSITSNNVAIVNHEKCTGCGKCVVVCPRAIIELIPRVHKIFLACSNHDRGPKVKKYCTVGCTTCVLCVKATPSGAIAIQNNIPKLDYTKNENFIPAANKCPATCFVDLVKTRPKVNIDTKCDGCGECIPACPVPGAILGEQGKRHQIDKAKCIGCGLCLDVCPAHAIALWGSLGYNSSDKRKWQRS